MEMCTVTSVNGVKYGNEGPWTTLDQIQGDQTKITDNIFGISARIIQLGEKGYKLTHIQIDPINEYKRMFEKENINIKEVYMKIQEELEGRVIDEADVETIMVGGIVRAIRPILFKEDKNNGTNKENDFINLSAFKLMQEIAYMEFTMKYEKEIVKTLEDVWGFGENELGMGMADKFVYRKYKTRAKEPKTGAERIVEFMKENGLTYNDLALALAMVQGNQLEVNKTAAYIISGQGDKPRNSNIDR